MEVLMESAINPGITGENAIMSRLEQLEKEIEDLKALVPEDRATIVVFSGDLDKVLAAFVIATGAAAAGLETSMFFTFWGLCALKKKGGALTSRADASGSKVTFFVRGLHHAHRH